MTLCDFRFIKRVCATVLVWESVLILVLNLQHFPSIQIIYNMSRCDKYSQHCVTQSGVYDKYSTMKNSNRDVQYT